MNWHGVMPAMTTCFDEDLNVDHAFMAKHAKWLLDSGCTGIVSLGSLGEAATLTFDEKVAILKNMVATSNGRASNVAAISALSTADAVAEDAAIVTAADEATTQAVAEDASAVAAADEAGAEAIAEAAATISAASISLAEARILRYLPTPLTFALIADKLGISRSAAKDRARRLYQKLGVHSRADAVTQARALGLID